MKKKQFIDEIKRRFPDSDIETVDDALDRIKDTEYEYIFSEEIKQMEKKRK